MNILVRKIIFLMLFGASIPIFGQNIKQRHLSNYVTDCLDHWFYPNHKHVQLRKLGQSITREIVNSKQYDYEWNWDTLSYDTVYSLEYVEQMLRGAVIQDISENSFHYAREITSRENAQYIAEYIYNYLFNYCSQTAILGQGIFAGCIGRDLKNWVTHIDSQLTPSFMRHYRHHPTL